MKRVAAIGVAIGCISFALSSCGQNSTAGKWKANTTIYQAVKLGANPGGIVDETAHTTVLLDLRSDNSFMVREGTHAASGKWSVHDDEIELEQRSSDGAQVAQGYIKGNELIFPTDEGDVHMVRDE
jgi:hypothetical protein